jgi:hypothetical protein
MKKPLKAELICKQAVQAKLNISINMIETTKGMHSSSKGYAHT